jgi:hypothetical protein
LKLLHGNLETVIAQGLAQTVDYAKRAGADEAHLFIFDRESGRPWDERIWRRTEKFGETDIAVWGA